MKINATKQIEVEIDDIEISRIILQKYCELFDIKENYAILDGEVYHNNKHIRKATDLDLLTIPVLVELKNRV